MSTSIVPQSKNPGLYHLRLNELISKVAEKCKNEPKHILSGNSTTDDSPSKSTIHPLYRQFHRLKLHPYISKKSRMPHRNLFTSLKEEPISASLNLMGEMAMVVEPPEMKELNPIVYQFQIAEKETDAALCCFERILTDPIECVEFVGPEAECHKYILTNSWRISTVMDTFVVKGVYGLREKFQMIGNGRPGPITLLLHYEYDENLLLKPTNNLQAANIFIAFQCIKGHAGTGGTNGGMNLCCRQTLYISSTLCDKSMDPKKTATKLPELQCLSRLLEEEMWFVFESRVNSPQIKNPLYLSYARNSFAVPVQYRDTIISSGNKEVTKREWFFYKHAAPNNAKTLKIGVTQYFGLFSEEQQNQIDKHISFWDCNFERDALFHAFENEQFESIDNLFDITICDKSSESAFRPFQVLLKPFLTEAVGDTVFVEISLSRLKLIHICHGKASLLESWNDGSIELNCRQNMKAIQNLLGEMDRVIQKLVPEITLAAHRTFTNDQIQRTKLFTNYTYLWNQQQLEQPGACYAAFTRASMLRTPDWIPYSITSKLEDLEIIKEGFISMVAVNIYETGDVGLNSHFDDEVRFTPPIISYQPFSGKRIVFGTSDSGQTNPLFFIPMPRGSIFVLEPNSYAVKSVKHGIRAQDLNGKSGAIILRHIPDVICRLVSEYTPEKAKTACECSNHSTGYGTVVRVNKRGTILETPVLKRKRVDDSPARPSPKFHQENNSGQEAMEIDDPLIETVISQSSFLPTRDYHITKEEEASSFDFKQFQINIPLH